MSYFVESKASDEAKKRGLTYASFGRWKDKTGKVVAKSEGDKLVMIDPSAKGSKPADQGPYVNKYIQILKHPAKQELAQKASDAMSSAYTDLTNGVDKFSMMSKLGNELADAGLPEFIAKNIAGHTVSLLNKYQDIDTKIESFKIYLNQISGSLKANIDPRTAAVIMKDVSRIFKLAMKLGKPKPPSKEDIKRYTKDRLFLTTKELKSRFQTKDGSIGNLTLDTLKDDAVFMDRNVAALLNNTYGSLEPASKYEGDQHKYQMDKGLSRNEAMEVYDVIMSWKDSAQYTSNSEEDREYKYGILDDVIQGLDLEIQTQAPIYRGMALKPGREKAFLSNFTPGKKIILDPVGFSIEPSVASTFGVERAASRDRNVAVQFILEPTDGKIKGVETSAFGYGNEREVITPTGKYEVLGIKKVNLLAERIPNAGAIVIETHFIRLRRV